MAAEELAKRLPSVAAYLERLPRGIDSHPQCMVKASVYRDALDSRPLDSVLALLPDAAKELAEHPPPVSAWVPEVPTMVLMIAIRDMHFDPDDAGLDAYAEWTRQRNLKLLTRPLYRALFLVLSPQRLLKGVQRRWGVFRRGTEIETTESGPNSAAVRVSFPKHLYDRTALCGMRAAMLAALEAAGARKLEMVVVSMSDREAHYEARWA